MLSRQGPPLAVGDVNGDGLDDVFIGGGVGVPGKLFLQRKDGSFVESTQGSRGRRTRRTRIGARCSSTPTAMGCPTSTSRAAAISSHRAPPLLQDRLYINQGGGRFVRDSQALPTMLDQQRHRARR